MCKTGRAVSIHEATVNQVMNSQSVFLNTKIWLLSISGVKWKLFSQTKVTIKKKQNETYTSNMQKEMS